MNKTTLKSVGALDMDPPTAAAGIFELAGSESGIFFLVRTRIRSFNIKTWFFFFPLQLIKLVLQLN
jgi:hypothetical protein